jgi:type II secretory pathway pseudopilin PulG
MRKGASIIEMLAVIFVVGILLLPLARLTSATFRDVPRSYRSANVNTSILNALRRMSQDINRAVGLPRSFGGLSSDSRTLIIRLPEGFVCYGLDGDKIIRYVFVDSQEKGWGEDMEWSVPRAVINWKLLKDGDKTFAVEVHKYIEHRNGDVIEKKLANSYVFFVGAYPEPIK